METRERIRWKKSQKQQILDEAAELYILHPEWTNLQLIREAQKVLPKEDQRNLKTVSWKDSFKWFVDGIEEAAAKKVKELQGQEKGQVFSDNGKYQEEPEETATLNVVTLLSTLVESMRELSEETKKSFPIGIVGRLDDLQTRMDRIEGRFQQFMDQGLLVRLVPAGFSGQQPVVTQEVQVAPVQKQPLHPEPKSKTRKPRIVVVNTDSGHVKYGIEKGTQGYVSTLKFQDTYGVTTPEFKEFDYVLAYKKTPLTWVEAAKKFYPAGKFRAVSGGAVQVAEAIKALPLIEITD